MTQLSKYHVDATVVADNACEPHPAAAKIRAVLAKAGILGIRLVGHPGSGKTELIEATLKRLPAPQRVAVVVVNPASDRDAQHLRKSCGFVAHVNAATPAAAEIWHAISDLKLEHFDLLLIETAGGLATLSDLGQDATVAVFATSGGDDKAAEYHSLLDNSAVVLLTKTDLRPLVKFDEQVFRNDVRSINPSAAVIELSAITGSGLIHWLDWLDVQRAAKAEKAWCSQPHEETPDSFIG